MRRAHLLLGLGALLVVTLVLVLRAANPPRDEPGRRVDPASVQRRDLGPSPLAGRPVDSAPGSSASSTSTPPAPVLEEEGRTIAVAARPSDSCSEIQYRLDLAEATVAELEAAHEVLRREVQGLRFRNMWLDRDLLIATMGTASNGDTHIGAFLRSEEARAIVELGTRHEESKLLRLVCEYLEEFPVHLRPGEATWVAERILAKDWVLYARSSELAILKFLGPARLTAELPPAKLAELRAYYADDGVFD